jgi:hypothetical protein
MEVTVFWDATLCNLIEVYERFGGIWYFHLQGKKSGKKTSVIYQTTRRHAPELSDIHIHCLDNLKYHSNER